MSSIRDIVVDCAKPAAVARFWAAVLDGYRVAPYDQAELDRLLALGVSDVEQDPSVLVEPVDGVGARFFFQLVPEAKVVKNRIHLDLGVAELDAEVTRLLGLGGQLLAEYDDHVVLADIEGNEFCLLRQAISGQVVEVAPNPRRVTLR